MQTRYRGYVIEYDPPPIPVRLHDWTFAHEEFDGAPDSGDMRAGTAASLEDAKREIDLQCGDPFYGNGREDGNGDS